MTRIPLQAKPIAPAPATGSGHNQNIRIVPVNQQHQVSCKGSQIV